MFTGIVIAQGKVRDVRATGRDDDSVELVVDAPEVARRLQVGDSVAVNGVCLTATARGRRRFAADAMPETLSRTTLAGLSRGAKVNLELAATLSDRLGGHLVQGHVDGVGTVTRVEPDGEARRIWFEVDPELLRYVVPKGSIAIDGISLTIVEVTDAGFEIGVIPHTLRNTTLGAREPGDRVNIEVDILAKYTERLLGRSPGTRASDEASGSSAALGG